MTRFSLRALLVIVGLGAGIGIVAACSNQGEGEVCNILNDSDDCKTDEGLLCYDQKQLNNVTSDRCCPADRTKATHPACVTATASVVGDAIAPSTTGPDASDAGTTLQDAQVATDASDAAADAGDSGK